MVNKPRVHELAEGQYVVLGDTWIVGKRYKIQSVIGKGSYGAVRSAASTVGLALDLLYGRCATTTPEQVCTAIDSKDGEAVAVKRIPNVMQSLTHAKRVLREVCILRRMHHTNIICLYDVFVQPSSTGTPKSA
eukprot:scaffold853_cov386-Prasinococcus_capsulatus_cf.AAC.22